MDHGQGQKHGLVSLGWALHVLLANLSEGISHEVERLLSYCIVGRSQHNIVLLPSLPLLWVFLLVRSLPRLYSLSCLLLLRSWGTYNCICKCEFEFGGLTSTPGVASCRPSGLGRQARGLANGRAIVIAIVIAIVRR